MEAITLPHIQDGSMGILSRRPQFSAAIIEMKKIGKVVVLGFICKWEGILCHNCEGENRRTIFAFCILFLGMHPSYLQEHFKKKSGSIMKRESCQFETASNLGSKIQKTKNDLVKMPSCGVDICSQTAQLPFVSTEI